MTRLQAFYLGVSVCVLLVALALPIGSKVRRK